MKYVSLAEAGGYGLSAIEYMLGLRGAGMAVRWTPLFQAPGGYAPAASPEEAVRRLREMPLPPETSTLHDAVLDGAESNVAVLHSIPELWPAWRSSQGPTIGYTVWETATLPPHWPSLLASVDRLLTPSRFSADAMRTATPGARIEVVPHIHRPLPGHASGARFRKQHDVPHDHTVFYTIGSWTPRKAIWSTLHAYCSAFTSRDPTTLVVKTDAIGPSHGGDSRRHPVQQLVKSLVENYPDAPHVCLITRELPQRDLDDLHDAGGCFVSLAAAEGWGLGAFDAACAGRPVIMTGWGGQLDYLAPADALLLEYQLVPVRDRLGAGSYRPDQQWAQADIEQAIDRMRWVHAHREEAAAMGARLGARVRRQCARDRIAARLAEILRSVGRGASA